MNVIFIGKSHLKYDDTHHCHDTWEIIASLSGEGYVDFDDERIPFNETTVLCIPPGVNHSKHAPEGCRDLWMWFSDFPADDDRALVVSDDEDRNILNIGNIIYSMFYSESNSKQEIVDSLFESMKEMIIARSDKHQPNRRIEKVKSEMLQNFHNPDFSLTECLESHGYCADHMRRIFIDSVGISPVEYLTEIRIKAAKQLLENPSISSNTISKICELSGYNDIGYFSKIFKKKTGLSPSEYRKMHRG
jgi:AraC-like DNA-binding protein